MGLIIMQTNPIAKQKPAVKKTVRKAVKKPVAKRTTVSKKYLIEAVAERYGNLKFYYWNGREFTHSRDSAMPYNSMKNADDVRKEIKKTKLYVKLTKAIRIVPA